MRARVLNTESTDEESMVVATIPAVAARRAIHRDEDGEFFKVTLMLLRSLERPRAGFLRRHKEAGRWRVSS